MRFPSEDAPASARPYAVAVGADLDFPSEDAAKKALERYRGAMSPATQKHVQAWFLALRLATSTAAGGDSTEMARMQLYAKSLSIYPADVVKATFDYFARSPRDKVAWLPTLPEMIMVAERLASPRRCMFAAISAWTPKTDEKRRAEKARDLMFEAAEIEASVALKRRSDPEAHAAGVARAAELRSQAKTLRQGGEIT